MTLKVGDGSGGWWGEGVMARRLGVDDVVWPEGGKWPSGGPGQASGGVLEPLGDASQVDCHSAEGVLDLQENRFIRCAGAIRPGQFRGVRFERCLVPGVSLTEHAGSEVIGIDDPEKADQ